MHSSRSHDAVIRVYDDAGNVIEAYDIKGANALSNVLGKLVLQVRSPGSLAKHVMGVAPAGRSLYSSFWVGNRKSLTLRRRSSRRASHRGGVVRHPRRQGLVVS